MANSIPLTLPTDSHTARRLEHATPEHLHLTTRRVFIGPIPEGWLKSHRKEWYRHYVHKPGSSRRPTFTAAQPTVQQEVEGARNEVQLEAARQAEAAPSGQSIEIAIQDESEQQTGRPSSQSAETRNTPPASTTSLLHGQPQRSNTMTQSSPQPTSEQPGSTDGLARKSSSAGLLQRVATRRVHFNEASRLQIRQRAKGLAARGGLKTKTIKDGELIKADKMLVRIDITQQQLGEDFDEKVSQGVESKTLDKWREFMVVCRKHSTPNDPAVSAVLQLYKTRVIAATAKDHVKEKPKAQIFLSPRQCRVNLFSALDKTLAIWTRGGSRTTIYYLRPESGATSVEWYTFLRTLLGWKRAQTLQVNVPDLSVSLRLDDPFRMLETSRTIAEAAEGDDTALEKAVSDEKGAAGAIVSRCFEMLQETPEWADVLKAWSQSGRIGLAWKRYDRLEWVHGAVEQRMYGTIAMQRSHDLELRAKEHYPLHARVPKMLEGREKQDAIEEPAPVEGFLIRLTSQKGQDRRMGKMLFKRLYFASQNQYLLFLRPARATPPPPPKLQRSTTGDVPSSKQLAEQSPLSYDIEPYPLDDDKKIAWLDDEDVVPAQEVEQHDRQATEEAERNTNMLLLSDGFINLSDVRRVRKMVRGASAADENIDQGSDVDFDNPTGDEEPGDSRTDDGSTSEVDDDRIFELLMKNGLVVRLQAYSKAARGIWMTRLQKLVVYWTARATEAMQLYKATRESNLKALGIDERAEAQVGQFAYKWEVSQSYASPALYNLCGISGCRPIHLSGVLFRKPRRHTTFTRCHVILSGGHLLVFEDTLRSRTGKSLVHIHHERIAAIDLKGCYLYSGLLTENDLLYQNRTFDSNTPGHNALPRVYLEDGWTSTDEDAMTTFVIWHSKSKSWFRSSQSVDDVRESERDPSKKRTKLTRVSQLGTKGRTVVFKARSRAERDHWVLGIQVEIERLVSAEGKDDVRLVEDGKAG